MRLLIGALLLVALLSIVGLATPAAADDVCWSETTTVTIEDAVYTVVETVCNTHSDSDHQPTDSGNNTGCTYQGEQIRCTKRGGYWFASQACYAADMSDMYPAEEFDVLWEGNTDGALFMCMGHGPDMINVGSPVFFWVPPGQIPALVDPRVLAQRALDQMSLAVPEIGMAPQAPQRTTVGLETWLWVPDGQMGSMSHTVTAGPTSVTATARPTRVDWDLTEGATSCFSAGREWIPGSSGLTTDCSYTFTTLSADQPDGTYAVSATIAYEVTWTCTGVCLSDGGDLGEAPSPTSNTGIEVIERQTVVKVG
jgi:hypothetical protein